jgi:hypothetical protein
MDLRVILGSFGNWQGGLWLRNLKNSTFFTNPTIQNHHRPDDCLRTTDHNSFDPLVAGKMDLWVVLGSFGYWQGGLWLRSLQNSPVSVFAPRVMLGQRD